MKIEKMRAFGGYVLKCRFNYLLSVVKPTGQEMTAMEKMVCYRGPHAYRTLGGSGRVRRSVGKSRAGVFTVASLGRQGRVSTFRVGWFG